MPKTWWFWVLFALCGVIPTVVCGSITVSVIYNGLSLGWWSMAVALLYGALFLLGCSGLCRPFAPAKTVAGILRCAAGALALGYLIVRLYVLLRSAVDTGMWYYILAEFGREYLYLLPLAVACFCPRRWRRTRWILFALTVVPMLLNAVLGNQFFPSITEQGALRYYLNTLLLQGAPLAVCTVGLCPRPRWRKKADAALGDEG